jgi:hypothetical protein
MDAGSGRWNLVPPRAGTLVASRPTTKVGLPIVRPPQPRTPQLLRRVRPALEPLRSTATSRDECRPGRFHKSSRRPVVRAPPAATAATMAGAWRPAPSRDRRIRRSDRTARPRLGSCRTDAAAARSGRTAHRSHGPGSSPADRSGDKDWARRALRAEASTHISVMTGMTMGCRRVFLYTVFETASWIASFRVLTSA